VKAVPVLEARIPVSSADASHRDLWQYVPGGILAPRSGDDAAIAAVDVRLTTRQALGTPLYTF
jgi:hypothetical protein